MTLILVHIFLWVKDRIGTWHCSNGIFKHTNYLNKNVQIWCIYSLTSLCSQTNLVYHLHNACIIHPPPNTMSDVRVRLWECLVKWVLSRYVVCCTIWYQFYKLKNVKNTHGGVLLLVKLQASVCNFSKSNTPPWVFLTFLKLYKWYQIVQRITYFL